MIEAGNSVAADVDGRRSAGFTIVELLVVLTIIAVLFAIVVPAVNSAREASRRIACQASQTKLAFSMSRFNNAKGFLPGWRNKFNLDSGVTHTYTPSQPAGSPAPPFTVDFLNASWAVMLLPDLGRTDQYVQMQRKIGWDNTVTGGFSGVVTMPEFICPSAGSAVTWQMYPYATLMYGVNVADNNGADGVLVDRVMSAAERPLSDVQSWDGLSTTWLLADAYFAGWPGGWGPAWHVALIDRNAVIDVNNIGSKYGEPKGNMLGTRGGVLSPVFNNTQTAANGGSPVLPLPRSAHPRGVGLTFCDGSNRFVLATIAPHVYGHLSTSRSVFNGTNYLGVNGTSTNAWLMAPSTPARTEPYPLSSADY